MRSFFTKGVAMVLLAAALYAQGQKEGIQKKSLVEEKVPFKARAFDLSQVRLLSGPIKDLLERNRKYLLSLSVDRLVHNFRVNAGLPSTAEPLGGWEAPNCELRGHFTGHFMSACALMYASTGDKRLKEKGSQVVDALAKCQQALGPNGYLSAYPEEFIDRVETGKRVWAPYYTLHKIMAGLFDMYTLCEDKQALDALKGMAAWTKKRLDKLDDKQVQDMLRVEFGGMAEVLANLYAVTGDPVHLALARRFEKRSFLDPLKDHRDELKGLHVNTHIPQAIGAAREYELTGEKPYYDVASFFWNQIVDARSYVTGGTSDYEYWRGDPYKLADQLSQESHENCCTYNMLRLTEHLFSWSADARYFEYYERAFFSGILPTHHPTVRGAIMYYVPLKSGLFKMFGVPDSSYFCCNGSGIESFAKLGNNIYYHNDDGVFINLFIASEVKWAEKGVTIRQQTKFPEQEGTRITLKLNKPAEFTLDIRIPSWATKRAAARINGKPVEIVTNASGYLALHRIWRQGDRIDVRLPLDLRIHRMPDDPTVSAILYGPIVLAGALGTEKMSKEMENGLGVPDVDRMVSQGAAAEVPALVVPNADPNTWIKPVRGKPLTFRTFGVGKPNDVTLIPFYKTFGQRYAVYWNTFAPYEWKVLQESRPALPAGVIDRVAVGDHQSEREHNFQAYRFQTGERLQMKWVKSPLWFRFDLNIDPAATNTLKCTYWGGDKDCSFDILIDGVCATSQKLSGGKDTEFIDISYQIPPELVKEKKRIAVMFRAKERMPTAELYACTIVKSGE